jgi:hypothetical protein
MSFEKLLHAMTDLELPRPADSYSPPINERSCTAPFVSFARKDHSARLPARFPSASSRFMHHGSSFGGENNLKQRPTIRVDCDQQRDFEGAST